MSVNKAIIVGRLGNDPEIRYTQDQNPIATLSVATSFVTKSKTGERQEETEWHRIVCFGRNAELAKEYVRKGQMIYIEGRIRTNKWQDNQGNNRYTTEIICSDMRFLSSKNDSVPTEPIAHKTPAHNNTPKTSFEEVPHVKKTPTPVKPSTPDSFDNMDEDDVPF